MEEAFVSHSPEGVSHLAPALEYLSVREAADIIGVSERSMYGYVEQGKLTGVRIGHFLVVRAEQVYAYQRRAPGRARVSTPRWHLPPEGNYLWLTALRVAFRPGQNNHTLKARLANIRRTGAHVLPGTSARYLVDDEQPPEHLEILLIWRSVIMPPTEERQVALDALSTDLAEILDWETAQFTEGKILLYAS